MSHKFTDASWEWIQERKKLLLAALEAIESEVELMATLEKAILKASSGLPPIEEGVTEEEEGATEESMKEDGVSSRAADHFGHELWLVMNRLVQEYDVSYAEIIGVLEMFKGDVLDESVSARIAEAMGVDEEDDEDDEDE